MEEREVLPNIHYIPIIIFITLPTTFIVTYLIAVKLDHVEPGFPYISDTGTNPPESCIFGQLLNIIATLMCFLIYIRYCQVKEYIDIFNSANKLRKWNDWALVFGILSSIGMSIVANFQETSVFSVHVVGALLCFGGATIYFWLQSVCTYYIYPVGCSMRLLYSRIIISFICTIFFVIGIVTAGLSQKGYKGKNSRKWTREDGGWDLHITSTITEWICAVMMCIYILTFSNELKACQIYRLKIVLPTVKYKNDRVTDKRQVSKVNHEQLDWTIS